MNQTLTKTLIILPLLLFLLSCEQDRGTSQLLTDENETVIQQNNEEVENIAGTIITRTITSEALANNLLDENINQKVKIYLPPSYETSDQNYPVIYYLHGWGSLYNDGYYLQKSKVDNAILNDGAQEFIIVEPNGWSTLGGSFYWNSPVSGNWEDFIAYELVDYMDENFRTSPFKEARGLAGYSMGGTGAINIGFKHSDRFDAIYAMAPGVLQDGDLDLMLETWQIDISFSQSYGAAASPNSSLGWPYAEIPYETYEDAVENLRVITNWYNLFGNQESKISDYLSRGNYLSGIKIQANSDDYFSWIPNGSRDLHRILTENEIEHEFVNPEYGGHNLPTNFVTNNLLPFFTENLVVLQLNF